MLKYNTFSNVLHYVHLYLYNYKLHFIFFTVTEDLEPMEEVEEEEEGSDEDESEGSDADDESDEKEDGR